jgi:hypothetical protein
MRQHEQARQQNTTVSRHGIRPTRVRRSSTSLFKCLLLTSLVSQTLPAAYGEAHCAGNVASLPLRVVQGSLNVVQIEINYSGPYDFVVDTGSQVTIITCAMQPAISRLLPAEDVRKAESVSGNQPHFVCNVGYSIQQCHEQMSVLRPLLAKYGADRLGDWTWVLVKSEDWKSLQQLHGTDPNSPAFSFLRRRQTFFEEAMVGPVPGRSAELIREWARSIDQLLDFAVSHELGHALCNEGDERKADAYGQQLRKGETVICK